MADDYTFNVRANISNASDKLKQVSDYMDAINNKADKGALNSKIRKLVINQCQKKIYLNFH